MRYKFPLLCLSTLAACSIAGMAIADTASAPAAPSNFTIAQDMSGKFNINFYDLSNVNQFWRIRLFSLPNTYGTLSPGTISNPTVTSSIGATVSNITGLTLEGDRVDYGDFTDQAVGSCSAISAFQVQLIQPSAVPANQKLVTTIQACVNDTTCSVPVLSNVITWITQ